jgi:Trypsin-like peptidase domain
LRQRTTIEPRRAGSPAGPPPEPVRPPRPWYLIPVLLAVLAAGVGAGWLVRDQADAGGAPLGQAGFDPDDVVKTTGPAVVRVFSLSCSGTGRATGVMIDGDRVLTVASALTGPVAVAVQTADGRIREARVIGQDTSGSGVAVLQVRGESLGIEPAAVAASVPADTTQDVPVIGYRDDAKQVVNMHAITTTPAGSDVAGVSGLFPASSAGAPVLDRSGKVIAMLVRAGPDGARTIGLAKLRQLVGGGGLSAMRRPDDCRQGQGSTLPLVPTLAGPGGDLAREAQKVLGEYVTEINRHNVRAVRDLFTGYLVAGRRLSDMRAQYRWMTIFDPVIHNVVKDGAGAQVEMTHAELRAPDEEHRNLQCVRYDIVYRLKRVKGELNIEAANRPDSSEPWTACN